MSGQGRDEVTSQPDLSSACHGLGPARLLEQSGGQAPNSSEIGGQWGLPKEGGPTCASVYAHEPLDNTLILRVGPYPDHMISYGSIWARIRPS
jgi:hypothetical protein